MKSLTLLTAASLLASAHAWTFTYRNADGKASTISGEGPHPCVEVDNEKGQVFELDGQGEKNINMLMFTTPDCSGKAAGMATESFSKKASVTIRGFKVVSTADGGSSSGGNNSSATHTGTASSAGNATVTSGPSSSGKTVTLSDATTSTASAAKTAATEATTTPATTAAGASGASGTAASASPSGTASGDSGAVALAGNSVKVLGGLVVGLVTFGWLL
ncbi:hypothetical protein ATEIFO6365_0009007200 [Aspergillus terreus]|uniref:Uncharacterized protein n=1 Tax=Aspergillus terreus TaxID=33178 RepID=A0A5M3Z7E4_ASPTE|nr:hypothetical protein ATETN484_0011007200 [Aspergillus terreus]GFF18709.1 hypothetical protein ATEIFO6365_0009007200 [Aspergillus terreus]